MEEYQMLCPDCGHVRIEPFITYCKCQVHTFYPKEIDDALEEIEKKYGFKARMRKYLKKENRI